MTLEEAIAHAEQQAIRYEKEAKRKHEYGGAFYDAEVQACLICAEQHRQLAEWLKELIERRKLPEIIKCKNCADWGTDDCAMSQTFDSDYDWTNPEGYCHMAERRTDNKNG